MPHHKSDLVWQIWQISPNVNDMLANNGRLLIKNDKNTKTKKNLEFIKYLTVSVKI